MKFLVCGKERMYFATRGSRPSSGRNSARSAVGQEADVEDQVGVVGQTVLEAETDAGDQEVFVGGFLLEKRSVRCARSSWTLNFEVSTTQSAIARMGFR